MCLEMMPSWCRQVNWGNCGIPWVNSSVLCGKDDWKGQFWGLRYCLSKLRSLLSFPSGMTSHSKIAQFNWDCIGPLILCWKKRYGNGGKVPRIHDDATNSAFSFPSLLSVVQESRRPLCRLWSEKSLWTNLVHELYTAVLLFVNKL